MWRLLARDDICVADAFEVLCRHLVASVSYGAQKIRFPSRSSGEHGQGLRPGTLQEAGPLLGLLRGTRHDRPQKRSGGRTGASLASPAKSRSTCQSCFLFCLSQAPVTATKWSCSTDGLIKKQNKEQHESVCFCCCFFCGAASHAHR